MTTATDLARQLQLTPQQLATLQDLLARHTPQSQAWAYGSRVARRAHEGSDLDLVLRDSADPSRRAAGLHALRDALSDSSLPILVDVHDWADLPAAFRHEIERHHLALPLAASALTSGRPGAATRVRVAGRTSPSTPRKPLPDG